MFSSLKPHEDPNEVDSLDFEEAGDPRFGIVQVINWQVERRRPGIKKCIKKKIIRSNMFNL